MRHLHFDVIDSTDSHIRKLLDRDFRAHEPLVVSADVQSSPLARSSFESPVRHNSASVTIATPVTAVANVMNVAPLICGYAIIRTLRRLLSGSTDGQRSELAIRWPNSVLLNQRHVAGVVCERWFAPGGRSQWLLTSAHINVTSDAEKHGDEQAADVTSVQDEAQSSVVSQSLMTEAVDDFLQLLECADADGKLSHGLLRAIESRLAWVDDPVAVVAGGWQVAGLLHGLDDAGRLELRTADGVQQFDAGGVTLLRPIGRLEVWQGFPHDPLAPGFYSGSLS